SIKTARLQLRNPPTLPKSSAGSASLPGAAPAGDRALREVAYRGLASGVRPARDRASAQTGGIDVMTAIVDSRERPSRYSATAKLMHWFVAVAVIFLLVSGPTMKRLVPEGPVRDRLYDLHEAVGAL